MSHLRPVVIFWKQIKIYMNVNKREDDYRTLGSP